MPIRRNPCHDTDNPPGVVHFEIPLEKCIDYYKDDTEQQAASTSRKPYNALQDAFDHGLREGYLQGWEAARRRFLKQDILGPIDPNSEASR